MAGAGICAVCLGGGFAIHPCLARDPTRHPGWVRWLRLAGWGCCGQRRVNGNVGQRVAGAAVEAPPAGHQLRCAVAKRGVHLLGRELRLQVARHRCDLEMGHGTVDQAHVDLVTGLQRPQPVKAAGPGGRLLAKVTAEPILARRRTQPEPAGPGILDGHLDGPIGVEPEGGRHQRDTYGRDPQHDRYRTCHYPGRLTDPGADGVRAIWLMACPTAWLTVSLMARRLVSLACERTTATGWPPNAGRLASKGAWTTSILVAGRAALVEAHHGTRSDPDPGTHQALRARGRPGRPQPRGLPR